MNLSCVSEAAWPIEDKKKIRWKLDNKECQIFVLYALLPLQHMVVRARLIKMLFIHYFASTQVSKVTFNLITLPLALPTPWTLISPNKLQ
tara:strand:+ start:811 stop:1080 length:270 start_codon:yes stop_codon:yes gene_type:complete